MIFEFAGLPGCGKSTVAKAAARRLTSAGVGQADVRGLARKGIAVTSGKRRFLKGKPERASLFGSLKYGEDHPVVFRALFDWAEADTAQRLWNLEMMAQLWFADVAGHDGQAVLLDEGLVHRGASSVLGDEKAQDFEQVIEKMTFSHALIAFDCPTQIAMKRCSDRPRGAPPKFSDRDKRPDAVRFQTFADLLDQAAGLVESNGAAVLRLDASRPVETLGAEIADWITAQLVVG